MPDVYYSFEEEQALINGVAKHGKGNWRIILSDPDFRDILKKRDTKSCAHKWRRIGYLHSQGPHDKRRRRHSTGGVGLRIAAKNLSIDEIKTKLKDIAESQQMVNQKRLAIFEIVQEKGEQCMFLPVFREAIKYCNDLEKHNKAREVFLKTHLRNLKKKLREQTDEGGQLQKQTDSGDSVSDTSR